MISTAAMERYPYLKTHRYLTDFNQVQFLKAALDNGLIDQLSAGSQSEATLTDKSSLDAVGVSFLLRNLCAMQVVERVSDHWQLTKAFQQVLPYRDYLEAKIAFANLLAPDLLNNLDAFLSNEQAFMERSQLFELFDYGRAIEDTAENRAFTRRWVSLTTALTRHESSACLNHCDLSATQAMLDIGGNSGEFALQISRRHPHISATVIDLPVVCEVGREHVAAENPSASIQFMAADALSAALPTQQCLVTFKSILHDWPEPAVEQFFRQAHRSLRSGGRVLIFERAQLDPETQGVPDYGDLSTFLFYRSYRQAQIYQEQLQAAGFTEIELASVQLETPFHLITATKP